MSDIQDLAEAYVLHLLDDAEWQRTDARVTRPVTEDDDVLASAVAAVRARFHDLDLSAEPVAPSDHVWDGIVAALDALPDRDQGPGRIAETPARDASDTESRVVPFASPKPPTERKGPGPWRPVALLALAASLALAAGLAWQVLRAPTPLVMAILVDDAGNSVAVVEAYADDRVQITPLQSIAPGGAQVLQVWTKPDPDGPPVSLGILDAAARAVVAGPDLPRPSADQLYEITVEPAGGSPTGLPTGRIVGKGLAQQTY